MRQRHKKHLEERLEVCNALLVEWRTAALRFDAPDDGSERIDPAAVFGREAPLHLEIGCGKGAFLCEIAARNPDVNFLAIEKDRNVLLDAAEAVKAAGLQNVRLTGADASYLGRFLPPHAVERLYLNFSTPMPKARDACHRLTHARFLAIYDGLLTKDGDIWQKTDNRGFFEFSLEQFSQAGFALRNVSLDLHNSDFPDNIVTEYERKFSEQGFHIYRLEAYRRG